MAADPKPLAECREEDVPNHHALVYGRVRVWNRAPSDNHEVPWRWSKTAWWKAMYFPHRGPPAFTGAWGVYAGGNDGYTGPGDAELTHFLPMPPEPGAYGVTVVDEAERLRQVMRDAIYHLRDTRSGYVTRAIEALEAQVGTGGVMPPAGAPERFHCAREGSCDVTPRCTVQCSACAAHGVQAHGQSVTVETLRQHWLRAMECDHATGRDKPHCSCSLVDLGWHPSVGAAVEAWLAHVAGVKASDDAQDARRYRQLRKGLPLTVIVPTPTEDKPNKKVTVSYGPNPEPAWGESLDCAVDAACGIGEVQRG